MKKVIFGLIAIVFMSVNANAQEISKEEARVYAAKTVINFKNSLKSTFDNSRDFEDFIRNSTGPYNPTTIPNEGRELLRVAYDFLSENKSDNAIISTYSGKEIANAFAFLQKNPTYEESQLFGFKTGEMKSSGKGGPNADFELALSFEDDSMGGCRWWQIRCHFQEVLGPELGDKLLTFLVNVIIDVLSNL